MTKEPQEECKHLWDCKEYNPKCHICGKLMRDDSFYDEDDHCNHAWEEGKLYCMYCGKSRETFTPMTPQEETYQTLENKALAEFRERFVPEMSNYFNPANIETFLKYHLQLAYKAGEEKGYDKGKDDNNKIIVEEDKPTKECKHEELLGDDYTEDCSVKLFGYRDKKGVTHITREEVSSPKIDSLLKEADKSFDEMYFFADLIPFKGQLTKREIDARNKDIKKFWHSQIELAYKAGQEEEKDMTELFEDKKGDREEIRQQAITETEKAFGGCKKCYGKGYSTEHIGKTTAFGDFDGEKDYTVSNPHIEIRYCSCERGKELHKIQNKLITSERERIGKWAEHELKITVLENEIYDDNKEWQSGYKNAIQDLLQELQNK